MAKPLLVVESPTKIKTIQKYIGKDYNVVATVGHIRDLPPKELGIDVDKEFKGKYVNIKDKSKVIKNLKKEAKDTTDIYLAPDPDREGEAIAFHTAQILKQKDRKFHRILFHELTKKGITQALSNPLELNTYKFDSQKTRRKLDRLVGYQLSPLLWRKVQQGLSAGRVQSVAVKIIIDREREIRAFVPEEYWSITVDLEGQTPPVFNASLTKINGKKAKISDEKMALKITEDLNNLPYVVDDIKKKQIKRNPLPPFITSKLQQDAINRLRFSAKKTMIVAQQLYEGIEIGTKGPEGLITYMRTDSTRIASDAAFETLKFIENKYGKEFSLSKPRFFKNKKNTQDAHECIRPTSVTITPGKIQKFLSNDQFKLYDLIWKRFVASQMSQAKIDQKTIVIKAGSDYQLSLGGNTIAFAGFMKLYATQEKKTEKTKQELPELSKGDKLQKKKVNPKQHFTKPPARFSEASLVKELEENGIGRPSTYAAILSTIRDKGYVDLIKRYFIPSELGFIVNDLLVDSFPEVLTAKFTASLENNLDSIEIGKKNSVEVLRDFYSPFKEKLELADKNMLNVKGQGIKTDLECPECKKELTLKIGRNGHFIACSGYPECSFTSNYERDEKGNIEIIKKIVDNTKVKECEKCGKDMVLKDGSYGVFLACTGYPECKNTESVNGNSNGREIGMKCPIDKCSGDIVEKKSRRGKIFFGCNKYPDCTFASWDKPVDKKCPDCESMYLVEKTTKKDGKFLKCPEKDCSFKKLLDT
ncbi:MAG: type I DNA topoisomerase [Desulfobacteraceae bacterium]|nr:type I DNA topoisomerase [Desulfobacteraceae bacterium]